MALAKETVPAGKSILKLVIHRKKHVTLMSVLFAKEI